MNRTLPDPPRTTPPRDATLTLANHALLSSLVAPCCGPFGLLGAFLALRSMAMALREGRSFPWRAVCALLLSLVFVPVWALFTWALVASQLELKEKRDALQQRLAGRRDAEAIDQQLACDLVEEQLRLGMYERWLATDVTCRGPLESGPGWALLRGVDVESGLKRASVNACLARTRRWMAVMTTAGETCTPLPEPPAGVRLEDHERTVRQQAAEQEDAREVSSFGAALVRVRETLAAGARGERACPPVDAASIRGPGHDHLRLRTVDLALLGAGGVEPRYVQWEFLTSSEVGLALAPDMPIGTRASMVREMAREAGPFLLVYQADQRRWPAPPAGAREAIEGRFEGWMTVVDIRGMRTICEARLAFATSARFWERSEDDQTAKAAVKDFRRQFERRATAALRTISDGHFRLGYELLE